MLITIENKIIKSTALFRYAIEAIQINKKCLDHWNKYVKWSENINNKRQQWWHQ